MVMHYMRCKRGHRLTDDNVYVWPSGKRTCLTCRNRYGSAPRPKAKRVYCARDHLLVGDNLRKDRDGHHRCKTCDRDRQREYARRKRARVRRERREEERRFRQGLPATTIVPHLRHAASWAVEHQAALEGRSYSTDHDGISALAKLMARRLDTKWESEVRNLQRILRGQTKLLDLSTADRLAVGIGKHPLDIFGLEWVEPGVPELCDLIDLIYMASRFVTEFQERGAA